RHASNDSARRTKSERLNQSQPSVSFAGCSWLMIFHLGVLDHLSETYSLDQWRFAGSSSGALTAALGASGTSVWDAKRLLIELAEASRTRRLGPVGRMSGYVRDGLERTLPSDAHERASNRLRIGITTLPRLDVTYASQFSSRAELIDAILASCYIPIYYERPVKFRGQWCIDGGLRDNQPRFDADTITVAPRSGATQVNSGRRLPRRLSYFPADSGGLEQLFGMGQRAARAFGGWPTENRVEHRIQG
ncbi:MAG: patatin-like phospholipase family protein, partial [Myxococcales bacterium]|nr:patatin-like phospholipase family protein [Myxococcales bacterium]